MKPVESRNVEFKYYQPNKKDLKDKYGDCVIRALTVTLNKQWLEVFDEMIPLSRELQCPYNSKTCYEKYLKLNGAKYFGISNAAGSKRPTVLGFTKAHKDDKDKKYILVVANHLVGVKKGFYFDTWDSGDKCLYGYWEL